MIQTTPLLHQVVHQLEPYAQKVLNDYQLFIKQDVSLESKEFTAYHNACKSALAHLLLLTKLIQPMPESPEQTEKDWADLVKNAPDLKQEIPDDFE